MTKKLTELYRDNKVMFKNIVSSTKNLLLDTGSEYFYINSLSTGKFSHEGKVFLNCYPCSEDGTYQLCQIGHIAIDMDDVVSNSWNIVPTKKY